MKRIPTKPWIFWLGTTVEAIGFLLLPVLTQAAEVPSPSLTETATQPIVATPTPTEPTSAAVPTADSTQAEAGKSDPVAPASPALASPAPAIGSPQTNPVPTPPAAVPSVQTVPTSAPPAVSQGAPASSPAVPFTGIRILAPTPDAVVDVPATSVVLQFAIGTKVQLRVNGVLVDEAAIGRTEKDTSTNLVTQTWYGVTLREGENTIEATVVGSQAPAVSLKVQLTGSPKGLKISSVESRIPADGRSTATIQGQLLDAAGNRANRDLMVTLTASLGEFIGADADTDQPGFQVKATQGLFTAQLRSSLEAQTVRVRANPPNFEAFTQLQFETNLRPSIVTGVIDFRVGARGTDFYRSFREFLPPDGNNRTQVDLRSSVFATGRIGEWLLTGAYNSDRTLNEDCNGNSRLYRDVQFCDQKYPVYGDSSTFGTITPSQDSLYLRFERSAKTPGADPDFAMWGDYDTKEFALRSQQYTATSRQLHGFKLNYNLGNLQVTGFYGDNVQGFQRDTVAPDGTSGFYFLSRRLLIPGSENVFLELEELNRPGTVLDRKPLTRGPDYEIDYDRGTLIFRRPQLRTDLSPEGLTLVRRIVVTYQYDSQSSGNNIYAGRLRYNLSRELNRESWFGASYLRENQGSNRFELYGADALISLGANSQIIAEYARSSNSADLSGLVNGSAYRLEALAELFPGTQVQGYYRSTDAGFSNNATLSFVPGQSRYGAQVTSQIAPTTSLRVQYDHEDNFGIAPRLLTTFQDLFNPGTQAVPGSRVDNSLTTISAGIQQMVGSATVNLDYIHRDRQDRLATTNRGLNSNADQLRSRFTLPLTPTLTFRAQNELTLSSGVDAVYPDRTVLALDWAVYPGIQLTLGQQFFNRGQYAGNSITSLSVNGDYKLGTDTTLTGRYSILGGANGMTSQGAIGLNQRWAISPGLRLDLAYERLFGDFAGITGAGQQFVQPVAVGQSASALAVQGGDNYSIGLEYSDNPDFQASARYEFRTSSSGSNTVITAAALGKVTPSLTTLFRYQQANASNQTLVGLGDTATMRVGLAYRDIGNDNFNALLRYEYRKNPSTIPNTILFGTGTGSEDHTLAGEAIYAPNWQWEFYGKYALRNSTSFLASDLVGTSTISLAQLRATYRLGYNMDLVGEARWIGQPSTGFSETGFVLETGYYLTPNLRVSAGYSSGSVNNDRDFSGSRSAGGFYMGLTFKLNELFEGFGLQKVAPPQQQESVLPPIATVPAVSQLDLMGEFPAVSVTNSVLPIGLLSSVQPVDVQPSKPLTNISHRSTFASVEEVQTKSIPPFLGGLGGVVPSHLTQSDLLQPHMVKTAPMIGGATP